MTSKTEIHKQDGDEKILKIQSDKRKMRSWVRPRHCYWVVFSSKTNKGRGMGVT